MLPIMYSFKSSYAFTWSNFYSRTFSKQNFQVEWRCVFCICSLTKQSSIKSCNTAWFGEYCCTKGWEIMEESWETICISKGTLKIHIWNDILPLMIPKFSLTSIDSEFHFGYNSDFHQKFLKSEFISCFHIFPIQIVSLCLDWELQAQILQNSHCWSARRSALGTLNNRKILILLPKGIFLILSKIKWYSDNNVIYIWTQCRLSSFCLKT